MTRHASPLGKVDLLRTTTSDLLDELVSGAVPAGSHLHFVNAYSIVSAARDHALARVFSEGACYVDGLPVIWGLRLTHPRSGWSRLCRVRGPDFFTASLDRGRETGLRHYFLGSTPSTLELLQRESTAAFPGLSIVGSASPPFAPVHEVDWEPYLREIKASNPDVVWVGLGTPKQDHVAAMLAAHDTRPYVAVGAAFDFVAGTVRRAPGWMQEAGLEWLYRLLVEPRRLWRRYLIGNVHFVRLVWSGRKSHSRGRT